MVTTPRLYEIAEQENIPIVCFPLPENGSMSIQDASGCCIGLDESVLMTEPLLRTHLSHELGHCCTGSFYNVYAARDLRRKHENRADRWAIIRLIPAADLTRALASGCTTVPQLADHFCVTEDLVRKALCLHLHGNLAVEHYPFP